MSNNMRWKLGSDVTCRDINVIYDLKCNMCDHKETYMVKTVGENVVGFKSRINQDISDCRTDITIWKFPIHVHRCAMNIECLTEPYFQLNIMMKVKDGLQLEYYKTTL